MVMWSNKLPFFTVLIPTYNRAGLLLRALVSVEKQTFRDFDVVVMDDGSTDETRDVVDRWKMTVSFPVKYLRQENSGKIAAYNNAIPHIQGFFMVLLDSDDALVPTALELFYFNWHQIPENEREQYAGVEGLSEIMPSGEIAGELFPKNGMTSTYPEMRYKHGITGDKRHALRTSVMREYPFPLFAGEKHNRESIIWCRMAKKYVFRYFNEVVQEVYYQTDGLSAITSHRRQQSPHGFSLAFLEVVNDHAVVCSPKQLRRDTSNYIRYALHAGTSLVAQYHKMRDKRLWWKMMPEGVLRWFADKLQLFFKARRK